MGSWTFGWIKIWNYLFTLTWEAVIKKVHLNTEGKTHKYIYSWGKRVNLQKTRQQKNMGYCKSREKGLVSAGLHALKFSKEPIDLLISGINFLAKNKYSSCT